MPVWLSAGLVLGPLLIARMRRLGPAPGGIVVRPDAPKLDMAVVVDASPDDAAVKPLVASLTGARPQPSHIVIEPGAVAPTDVDMVVELRPEVVFATPEALDRIAHTLDTHPSIAVYPWVKTNGRADAAGLLPTLFEALSSGAFSVLPLESPWRPTSVRAYKQGHADDTPTVYAGGHIVAQPLGERAAGRGNPVSTALAAAYLASAVAAFLALVLRPSRKAFGLYAGFVFSLSVCLKQIAKFPRASAIIYPVVFAQGLARRFRR